MASKPSEFNGLSSAEIETIMGLFKADDPVMGLPSFERANMRVVNLWRAIMLLGVIAGGHIPESVF